MTSANSAGKWVIREGAAYLADSGVGYRQHLFVILNDPIVFPNKGSQTCVCVVNFSTIPTHIPYDPTCVFTAGDHPFIKHQSYVVLQVRTRIVRS